METTKRVDEKRTQPNTCPNCGEIKDRILYCDACDKEICDACDKGNMPFSFCEDCSSREDK